MQEMGFIVNVKFNSSVNVPVEVERSWSVKQVKQAIGAKQNVPTEDIRIIFQGRELLDSFCLQDCDLGNASILHVIRGQRTKPDEHGEDKQLLTQTLGDSLIPESCRRQFYIYCKSQCNAVQPGKLRVRCSSCRQGTFTVTTEPSEWDDVLEAGRIQGDCHTDGCHGNTAEFYFRCGNHLASNEDDTAMALHLIRANTRQVSCVTCTDTVNPVLVFACEDGHAMCLECFKIYCTTKLNDRTFIEDPVHGYTLGCPAGCQNSLITEIHHFRILGSDQYDRYQRFGTEEYVLQQGGTLCPAPGCGAGLLLEPGQRKVQCQVERSQGCGFVFCKNCMESYHDGDCNTRQMAGACGSANDFRVDPRNAERARWEKQSKDTIKKTTKPCPKCNIPVEKDGGCMHMVCLRCSYNWCWMCAKEWNRQCQGDHWFA